MPTPGSEVETATQRRLHLALTRARDALLDSPDGVELDGGIHVAELEARFDSIATATAQAACAAADLAVLSDLSTEGVMVVGSADVAIAALRAALESLAAAIDVARDAAA